MRYSISMAFWILASILWTVLVAVLALRWPAEPMSVAELERRAKHSVKFRTRLLLKKRAPAWRVLQMVFATIIVLILITVLTLQYQWLGTLIAAGALALAALFVYIIPPDWSRKLIAKHAEFFAKCAGYFAWFGRADDAPTAIHSRHELDEILAHSPDAVSDSQRQTIIAVLDDDKTHARDIMTPAEDIVFVRDSNTLGPMILDDLHKSGHAIFPVVRKGSDQFVGAFYIADALPLTQQNQKIADRMRRPLPLVGADETLSQLMRRVADHHATAFVVVDDEELPIGLLSIADIFAALGLIAKKSRTGLGDTSEK